MPTKKTAGQQTKFTNPIKALLKRGQSVIGATICVNSVEVAAQIANMGFDFLWLEMEHSPLSLETVRNIVLATRGLPARSGAPSAMNEPCAAPSVLAFR